MNCQNCSSSDVKEALIESYRVMQCQTCEHLHGDSKIIQKISEIREAKELSIDPKIYPLHKSFQKLSGVQIQFVSAGSPQEKVQPYLAFSVTEGGFSSLEKITSILSQVNKKTKIHWIVEAIYQKKLVFQLKPNFYEEPYHISAEQISIAQKDLDILIEIFSEEVK